MSSIKGALNILKDNGLGQILSREGEKGEKTVKLGLA